MIADTRQQLGKAVYLLDNCSQSRSVIRQAGQDSAVAKGPLRFVALDGPNHVRGVWIP